MLLAALLRKAANGYASFVQAKVMSGFLARQIRPGFDVLVPMKQKIDFRASLLYLVYINCTAIVIYKQLKFGYYNIIVILVGIDYSKCLPFFF